MQDLNVALVQADLAVDGLHPQADELDGGQTDDGADRVWRVGQVERVGAALGGRVVVADLGDLLQVGDIEDTDTGGLPSAGQRGGVLDAEDDECGRAVGCRCRQRSPRSQSRCQYR